MEREDIESQNEETAEEILGSDGAKEHMRIIPY